MVNWKPTAATQTGANPSGFSDNNNLIASYNPGDYYFASGTTKTSIEDLIEAKYDFLKTDNTWTPTYDYGFLKLTNYIGTDGITSCTKTAGDYKGAPKDGTTVCNIYYDNITVFPEWHYDQGNYDTWVAATAGDTRTSGSVEQSICPKGWKLPTIDEYESMLSSADIAYKDCKNGTCTGYSTTADSNKIQGMPYNFIYTSAGGNNTSPQYYTYGKYWSRNATTTSGNYYGYLMEVNENGVFVNTDRQYLGFPIRCVAQ